MSTATEIQLDYRHDLGEQLPATIIATSSVGGQDWRTSFNPNLYPDPVGRAQMLAELNRKVRNPAGQAYAAHFDAIASKLRVRNA